MTAPKQNMSSVLLLLCASFNRIELALSAAPPRSHLLTDSYTFESYVSDFDREYDVDSEEWEHRKGVFDDNLSTILTHNSLFYSASSDGNEIPTYTMGVNGFTDKLPSEIHLGYNKAMHPAYNPSSKTSTSRRLQSKEVPLPFKNEKVSKLPKHVDWSKNKGVVNPVRDQAGCGSCWAFATAEVLESHIAIQTGKLLKLSPQDLVSCVKNPMQCGGKGGCEGATPELGFAHVAEKGITTEENMPYSGTNGVCPAKEDENTTLRGTHKFHMKNSGMSSTAAASIAGYATIPTNDYETVMNAVAKTGPVPVAVAASRMMFHEGGVFHDETSTEINHAVVLTGYGTDEASGEDYYLVRNSWGGHWGEGGYIRIKRDSDSHCGMDTKPLDGLACKLNADGSKAEVKPVKVCGTIGILFDVSLPVGGYLVK